MAQSRFDFARNESIRSEAGVPYAKGSHCSYKAAVEIARSGTRGEKLQRLLETYRFHPHGLTDSEAAAWTNLPRSSICSLRDALIEDGQIYKTGAERMGPYGKQQTIWFAR